MTDNVYWKMWNFQDFVPCSCPVVDLPSSGSTRVRWCPSKGPSPGPPCIRAATGNPGGAAPKACIPYNSRDAAFGTIAPPASVWNRGPGMCCCCPPGKNDTPRRAKQVFGPESSETTRISRKNKNRRPVRGIKIHSNILEHPCAVAASAHGVFLRAISDWMRAWWDFWLSLKCNAL